MEKRKNNTALVVLLIIFILLTFISSGYIVYEKFFAKADNNEIENIDKSEESDTKEVDDSAIKNISADTILQAEGFAGSSDILIYLTDDELYEYHKSEEKEKKITESISRIYKENGTIYAVVEADCDCAPLNSNYVKFLYETTLTYASGQKDTIQYEYMLSPQGFAGSSSHVVFLKNNSLYYTNINENSYNLKLVAIGVDKITKNEENIVVTKNSNFIKYLDYEFIKFE